MPIHVLYGDEFLTSEALEQLRTQVGTEELLQANSHKVYGENITLVEMRAITDAAPFLAQHRLLVVEGLLGSFDGRTVKQRARDKSGHRFDGWKDLEEYLESLPLSTILVFLEGPLKDKNPLLMRIAPFAQVQSFALPRREELARWTRHRCETKGAKITPGALRLLDQHIGGNLRSLDSELEKLALYAAERPIEEQDVRALVPQVREASIFVAVDAILDGRSSVALGSMHRLREGGANLSYIMAMVARQLRLVVLAKDMLERQVATAEIGLKLEIRAAFALRKTLDQARKFPWIRLVILYRRLLETELAMKKGRFEEDLALDLLVFESTLVR